MLVGPDGARRLGAALAWARQQSVGELHLLADDADVAGTLARRAGRSPRPPEVWLVDGRELRPVDAGPDPDADRPAPGCRAAPAVAGRRRPRGRGRAGDPPGRDQRAGGRTCRLGRRRGRRSSRGGGGPLRPRGVRHGQRRSPDTEALAKAASIVRGIRRAGRPAPPAQPARPRALAAGRPDRRPVTARPARPRGDRAGPAPARTSRTAAARRRSARTPTVVRWWSPARSGSISTSSPAPPTTGPMHAPGARLVLAVPARDVHPVTEGPGRALAEPAEVVPVEGGWQPPDPILRRNWSLGQPFPTRQWKRQDDRVGTLTRWMKYGRAMLDDMLKRGNEELDQLEAEREADAAERPWAHQTSDTPDVGRRPGAHRPRRRPASAGEPRGGVRPGGAAAQGRRPAGEDP